MSQYISLQAIAKDEVVMCSVLVGKQKLKLNLFFRYRLSVHADIGRYACHHAVTVAALCFLRKLDHLISYSIILSIKRAN